MSLMSENQSVDHDLLSSVTTPFVKFHRNAGRNVLKQVINFNSYSDNGFSTTLYPPSSSCIIDSRILLQAKVSVTTTVANELDDGAPRAWCLASIMNSLSISVNGSQTNSVPRDLVYFLQRFNTDSLFRSKFWSMSPCQPDPCSHYNKCPRFILDTTGTLFPRNAVQAESTAGGGTTVPNTFVRIPVYVPCSWSPFCNEQFFKSDHESSRGSFPYTVNAGDTVNTYVFTEPLVHPLFSDNEISGLTNVRELGINITFDTNLLRLFSKATNITNGAVSLIVSPPKLLISYFEPEDQSKIPLQVSLPYTQHVIKNQVLGALSNTRTQYTFNNIVLGQVPSKMYVFARPSNSALNTNVADGFACIENVNFTIGNRSGILSSADSAALYQMSVANGLSMNWNEYSKRLGSIVCIDVSNDIGGLLPGSLGNVSISFTVDLANRIFTDALVDNVANIYTGSFDLYFIAELEGSYNISMDSAGLSLGLNVSDMIEASNTEPLDTSDVPAGSGMYGGSMKGWRKFYRGLKKGVRSVNRFMQKVASAPGMDSNVYLQGAAKILDQTNNMMSPQKQAEVLASGMMRGKGLLRL